MAAGLTEAALSGGTGAVRIMLFVGGPTTEGPGQVVAKELLEPIRSHKVGFAWAQWCAGLQQWLASKGTCTIKTKPTISQHRKGLWKWALQKLQHHSNCRQSTAQDVSSAFVVPSAAGPGEGDSGALQEGEEVLRRRGGAGRQAGPLAGRLCLLPRPGLHWIYASPAWVPLCCTALHGLTTPGAVLVGRDWNQNG